MKWHWFSAKKHPQVPALWLGGEKIDKYSHCIKGHYGLETKLGFFGVLLFHSKAEPGKVDIRNMNRIQLIKLHRIMFNTDLKTAHDAVTHEGWNGERDWKAK
jgi:hypothetical protein